MRLFIYLLLISFIIICVTTKRIRRSDTNTITVTNKGSKSINVAFFKKLNDSKASFQPERTVQVTSGSFQTITLPYGWAGRIQKLSGAPIDPATWAEIDFDAGVSKLIFCDISLIRGYNGAMLFSAQDSSFTTGFTNDLYPQAPNQFKTKDSGGNNVLQPTRTLTAKTNHDLVKYYRTQVSDGNAYILPGDYENLHQIFNKTLNLDIY